MRRILSISLLFVLAISIFPWEVLELCPNANGHHADEMHHGDCTDGMMNNHEPDEAPKDTKIAQADLTLKSLSCTGISPDIDSYNVIYSFKSADFNALAVVAILLECLDNTGSHQKTFYPEPDFLNNSGSPPAVNPLRGPPVV
jgi:hypothetical protein